LLAERENLIREWRLPVGCFATPVQQLPLYVRLVHVWSSSLQHVLHLRVQLRTHSGVASRRSTIRDSWPPKSPQQQEINAKTTKIFYKGCVNNSTAICSIV